MRSDLTFLFTCALLLALAPAAVAATRTDRDRAAARNLADEGLRLRAQGDHAGALDRFDRALALVDAPTIALRRAESLQELGRWVEASEAMLALGRRRLDPQASMAFRKAVAAGREQGQALRSRLPKMVLRVVGTVGKGVRVTVDGQQVPSALWGVAQPVDPGRRHVVAQRAGHKAQQVVDAVEGEVHTVVLKLPDTASAPSTAPASAADPSSAPGSVASADAGASSESGSGRTLAWTLVGVGAVGAVAGGVLGVMANAKNGDLENAGCKDGQCPDTAAAELDSYNTLRTSSYISLGVGAAGLIGGGVLVMITSPDQDRAGVHPWMGVASAGLKGRF